MKKTISTREQPKVFYNLRGLEGISQKDIRRMESELDFLATKAIKPDRKVAGTLKDPREVEREIEVHPKIHSNNGPCSFDYSIYVYALGGTGKVMIAEGEYTSENLRGK